MRSACGPLRVMFAIAAVLATQAAFALWRATPEIADTFRAIYHSVAGLCRHTFVTNHTEVVTFAALATLCGVLLVLARFAWHLVSQWRRTRAGVATVMSVRANPWPAAVAETAARTGVAGHVDVVDHPAPFAFCYGFFRPRICISSGLAMLLTSAELEAVLLHEEHHRRRREPLALLVSRALAHALFFIPILRDLQARYEAVKEFDADDAAVRFHGCREPMAGALYKVLTCPAASPNLGTAAVGGLSVTERRIDHLVTPQCGDVPRLSRRRLAVSGLTLSLISLPLVMLAVANVQPMVHACRF